MTDSHIYSTNIRVHAIQWNGANVNEIRDFCDSHPRAVFGSVLETDDNALKVYQKSGNTVWLEKGDYLVVFLDSLVYSIDGSMFFYLYREMEEKCFESI